MKSRRRLGSAEAALTGLILASRQLVRRLRDEWYGEADLTWSQVSILSHLDRTGQQTTADLARAEAMKPQSMGTALAGLEREGLVSRSPHPTDRRQVLFSITDAGRAMRRKARASRRDWIGRAMQTLTADECEILNRAADIIRRLDR